MRLDFKGWLAEGFGTGCKLGLYSDIDDALGQYPPLYGTPKCSDLITYLGITYPKTASPPGENGIVWYGRTPRHVSASTRGMPTNRKW